MQMSPLLYSSDRAASSSRMSSMYDSMTYRELQAAAKAQGVKANGSKAELLERLLEATPAADAAPEVDIEAPASPDKTAKAMNSQEGLTVKDLTPIRSVKKSAKKSAAKPPAAAPAEEKIAAVVVEAPVVVEKAATPVKTKVNTPKKSAKKSALKAPAAPAAEEEEAVEAPVVVEKAATPVKTKANTPKKSAKKSALKAPAAPAAEAEEVIEAPVVVEKASTPVKTKANTPKKSAGKSALKPKTPNPFTKIVTGKTPKAKTASAPAVFPPAAPAPTSETTATTAPPVAAKPMVAVEAWMTAKTPKIKAKAAPVAPAPAVVVKPTTLDLSLLASEASDEIDAIFNTNNAKPSKKASNTPKKTPANTPAKSKAAATPSSVKQAKHASVEAWAEDETEEPYVAGAWGADDEGDYYDDEDENVPSANSASTALFTSPIGSRMPQFSGVKVYLSSPLGSPKPVNKWTYADFGSPNSKHTAESDAAAAKAAAKAARKAEKRAAKKATEAATSSPALKGELAGAASPARTVFGNVTNA